jgi:DNA-directed RNA polymerase subunit RPC12/RpoP
MFPEVSRQWHPFKNGELVPEQMAPSSGKKVWWKCEKGHEWQADISSRTRPNGSGCPYCSGRRASHDYNLQVINPGLARQWHPTRNGNLKPEQVTPGSHKKVWWICEKGHEWRAAVKDRNKGASCPYCSGRRLIKEKSLLVVNPELADQWHPTKNGDLSPGNVAPKSSKKVWWRCKKGHEWQAVIASRFLGTNCPFCSRKKASKENNFGIVNPGLVKEWHPTKNGKLTPFDVTPYSLKKVWWLCKNGHEWQALINTRNGSPGCHFCRCPGHLKKHFEPRVRINKNYTCVVTTLDEKKKIKIGNKTHYKTKVVSYGRYVYGLEKIPPGYIIWHKDGDPVNNNLDNLECISRSEAMKRLNSSGILKTSTPIKMRSK